MDHGHGASFLSVVDVRMIEPNLWFGSAEWKGEGGGHPPDHPQEASRQRFCPSLMCVQGFLFKFSKASPQLK